MLWFDYIFLNNYQFLNLNFSALTFVILIYWLIESIDREIVIVKAIFSTFRFGDLTDDLPETKIEIGIR